MSFQISMSCSTVEHKTIFKHSVKSMRSNFNLDYINLNCMDKNSWNIFKYVFLFEKGLERHESE